MTHWAPQGAGVVTLEVLASDFLGGAAPELSVSGALSRGKKALANWALAFSAAGGGAYTADVTDLGLAPGVYTCVPCSAMQPCAECSS